MIRLYRYSSIKYDISAIYLSESSDKTIHAPECDRNNTLGEEVMHEVPKTIINQE